MSSMEGMNITVKEHGPLKFRYIDRIDFLTLYFLDHGLYRKNKK